MTCATHLLLQPTIELTWQPSHFLRQFDFSMYNTSWIYSMDTSKKRSFLNSDVTARKYMTTTLKLAFMFHTVERSTTCINCNIDWQFLIHLFSRLAIAKHHQRCNRHRLPIHPSAEWVHYSVGLPAKKLNKNLFTNIPLFVNIPPLFLYIFSPLIKGSQKAV